MRIIAGALRGRRFNAPPDDATRPTTDRVRESIFNLLHSRMELRGASVLDLFSGSGALALEAISRGAARAVLVEQHPKAVRTAKENASGLGVSDRIRAVRGNATTFLERPPTGRYDLVFADPPYELDAIPAIPDHARRHAPGGWLVLEHDKRISFDDHPALDTSRRYGRTVVSLFHFRTPESETLGAGPDAGPDASPGTDTDERTADGTDRDDA